MKYFSLVLGAMLTSACLLLACPASESTTGATSASACNSDPFSCPAGQTCWVNAENKYACLNAGPGKKGDSCQSLIGAPTCGEGLVCLQTSTAGAGECVTYCDPSNPARACEGAEVCTSAVFGRASGVIRVCYAQTSPSTDAGVVTDGATDATSSSDAGADDAGADDAAAGDSGSDAN